MKKIIVRKPEALKVTATCYPEVPCGGNEML